MSETMLVDMYNISGVPTQNNFTENVKQSLNHRPVNCLGVRLLMNLDDDSHYILVSYWPDEESMLTGTPFLHEQFMKAAEGAKIQSKIENFEIKHEI